MNRRIIGTSRWMEPSVRPTLLEGNGAAAFHARRQLLSLAQSKSSPPDAAASPDVLLADRCRPRVQCHRRAIGAPVAAADTASMRRLATGAILVCVLVATGCGEAAPPANDTHTVTATTPHAEGAGTQASIAAQPPSTTAPRDDNASNPSHRHRRPLGPTDDTATRRMSSPTRVPGCTLPRPTGTAQRRGHIITINWSLPAPVPSLCGRAAGLELAVRSLAKFGPATSGTPTMLPGPISGRQTLPAIVGDLAPPYEAILRIETDHGQWRQTMIVVRD